MYLQGKGYPDINTRILLKKLWTQHQLPIYVLVDADPFGIEIMLTYRHGSLSMSYCADELAVPAVQWLGVYPSEIKKLSLPSVAATSNDLTKLNELVKRPYITEEVYREILIMQKEKRKTEIEAMSSISQFYLIDSYLRTRVNKI